MAQRLTAVFCPAGRKTQILLSSSIFRTYRAYFDVPRATVDWERHSDLAPWFTWGTHLTDRPFDLIVAGNYCAFWFMSPVSLVVSLESIVCGEVDFLRT
jgi:hypothetical protein